MGKTESSGSKIRREAAANYRPVEVRLLLVAEAPPLDPARYFYFEKVATQDSLFHYVCKGLYEVVPGRADKSQWLERLKHDGVFLIDLNPEPVSPGWTGHKALVQELVKRGQEFQPEKVILIKTAVFDAAFEPLREAGCPVSGIRIPFPGSGQQKRFEEAFAAALQEDVE
ncbi:MAG: hypothetical protein WD627_07885 [Actinomycetota bacterium]